MKYIVILCDGMADYPIPALENSTPLEVANKPYMDMMAKCGILGTVKTVPDGMKPGSDVANLAVMGYNPEKCYTGRSPLEGISMGVEMSETDMSFRANVVTLSDEENYEDRTMVDYSAGEISTEEARELILAVADAIRDDKTELYPGVSYRHLLLRKNLDEKFEFTPPHDISGKKIKEYLPKDEFTLNIMKKSAEVLSVHPINKKRIAEGKNPATSIWVWGEGKKPILRPFAEEYGLSGAVISAVDLVKGIGLCADMDSIDVDGATGTIETNFDGKMKATLDALKNHDFVYLHMEAPDECGHHFDIEGKIKSIEIIDEKVIGPIYETLKASGEDFSILVLPDHPTPCELGTHVSDPVPFALFRSDESVSKSGLNFTEKNALNGMFIEKGYTLMKLFTQK